MNLPRRCLILGLMLVLLLVPRSATSQRRVSSQPSAALRGYARQKDYADIAGIYAGFSICADCSGIAVRLQLKSRADDQVKGTFVRKMRYIDAPSRSNHRQSAKDHEIIESGTWLLSQVPGSKDKQVCLTASAPTSLGTASPDCYRVVHQTSLVFINGFEEDHQTDPFPAGLKTLLKQRQLNDGHEYPMLPVDDWKGMND